MAEFKGMPYLKSKLNTKRTRVLQRYKYYEQKDLQINDLVIPRELSSRFKAAAGWCTKAVDSIADRLSFRGFDDDFYNMEEIFSMNNPDTLYDSAMLGALISSCDFISITKDVDGYPRMQVIDGSDATGIIDPITGMLIEGYAVLKRDGYLKDKPTLEAYYTPGKTEIYAEGHLIQEEHSVAPFALLVPVIYRPDAHREFGHSRISRACMDYQKLAKMQILLMSVGSQFYAYPQRYITGLDPDAEPMEPAKAMMSAFLQLDKSEDGTNPSLGQFAQMTTEPLNSTLRMYASLFAGETGLTTDDLGFVADNPSSSEAIKASHENLRLTALKAQKKFGSAFLNAGYLACCVRDDIAYKRENFYLTKPKWEPVFTPDASSLSLIGDGAIKLNQAVPGYMGKANLRDLTGIEAEEE